mmetsp:Transcript_9641/g.19147  ORF Transcript_9641/g.19147 Transcript_9641/m.19147 type:complete len:309 (-) Transcript_9641:94-1020(-)
MLQIARKRGSLCSRLLRHRSVSSSPSACLSELEASYHTSRLEVFGVSTQPTGGFPRFSSAGRDSSSVWKVDSYSKVALSECSGSRGFAAGRSISTFINPVLEKDEKKESNGEGSQEGAEKEMDAPAPPQSPEEMQAQIEEFKTQLEEKEKSLEDAKDKLVRTLADMENLRERTSRQLEEARQFATQGLVKSLVEVADNLERAASSVLKDVDEAEIGVDRAMSLLHSLKDGVEMTDGILMKILEKEGVKRYDPLGEAFDPNMHNALFEVPDATKEPGTVAVVIKKGYMLHDRAVRAAEVGVVKDTREDE